MTDINRNTLIIFLIIFFLIACIGTITYYLAFEPKSEIVNEPVEVYEPQNNEEYSSIFDSKLDGHGYISTEKLIKYDNFLFGKALGDYEIEGDLFEAIGTVSKLTDFENIPIYNGETNAYEAYQATIYRVTKDELVVQYADSNILTLYKRLT